MNKIINLTLPGQQIAAKCATLGVALEVAPHEEFNKFYIVQLYQVEKSITLQLSNYANEQNIRLDTD